MSKYIKVAKYGWFIRRMRHITIRYKLMKKLNELFQLKEESLY